MPPEPDDQPVENAGPDDAGVGTAQAEPETPPVGSSQPDVSPVVFPDLGPGEAPAEARPVAALADVALKASVEVGRIPIKLAELTTLSPGAVLTLGRNVDEPMTMRVNGRAFATCDVVVDEGRLAARISEIGGTHG